MGRVLYLLGGLFCAVLAVGVVWGSMLERRRFWWAAETSGQVVELEVEDFGEAGTSYRPVVEFRAEPAGEVVKCRPHAPASVGETMRSGHRVSLRYNRHNPTEAWVAWDEPGLNLTSAVVLLLIAAGLLHAAAR
jgi:hypothetical protein